VLYRWYARCGSRTLKDPRNPEFAVALQLAIPSGQLFAQRVWPGLVGVLAQLDAEVPVRPELRR